MEAKVTKDNDWKPAATESSGQIEIIGL